MAHLDKIFRAIVHLMQKAWIETTVQNHYIFLEEDIKLVERKLKQKKVMSHKLLLWTQKIFTTVHLWAQDMLSEMLMRDWLMSGLRCIHVLFTSYKAENVSEKYSPLKVKLKGMFENSVESEIRTCAFFHPKEEYLCQKTRIGRMLAPITLNWFVVHFKILVFQRITRESVFNLLQTALFIFLHFIQTYWSIVRFHIYNNFYKLDFEVSIENSSKKTCENHTAKF